MLEVERLCDRVIIMKRGRIEDDDSPDRIMARYNRATLEEVFLDVARGRVAGGARHERGRPTPSRHLACIASARWCCATGIS